MHIYRYWFYTTLKFDWAFIIRVPAYSLILSLIIYSYKIIHLHMKHKIVNVVLISCISALLISCNARKEEPAAVVVDKEQIKKDIQAREDEFATLYNAAEMKNIGYYAD